MSVLSELCWEGDKISETSVLPAMHIYSARDMRRKIYQKIWMVKPNQMSTSMWKCQFSTVINTGKYGMSDFANNRTPFFRKIVSLPFRKSATVIVYRWWIKIFSGTNETTFCLGVFYILEQFYWLFGRCNLSSNFIGCLFLVYSATTIKIVPK